MHLPLHDLDSLARLLLQRGEKPSHAPRVLRHFYAACGVPDWQSLEIPKSLRAALSEKSPPISRVLSRHRASDDTVKLLIAFASDAEAVEAVLMPGYRANRAAVCVSSQIGCAMGCGFCASTKNGLLRNLRVDEIVEQFLHLARAADEMGRKISSLVFMGMGEPMHNLENVIAAIRRIAHPDMGGLGWRQITVSTVGIVPGIEALRTADLNVHLALSLHAPDDATREQIVPAGRRYRVKEILAATRRFQLETGRITTLEYCLLAGINDSDAQAKMLADLVTDSATGFRAHVNLIPYNAITPMTGQTLVYLRPSRQRMEAFAGIFSAAGIITHFRRTRGDDVSAACGQLRGNSLSLSQ